MPDLVLLLLTVPTITAFIGWMTNWSAVKMIFWPPRFIGVGPIGWQSIIYKQGHKFATGVADMVTENLITTEELVGRLDPDEIQELLSDALDKLNPELCKEAAEVVQPGAWDTLPDHVKQMVLVQMKAQSASMAKTIFERLRHRADDLIDLHKLVYQRLSGENTERLARLTKRIGQSEFKFIEYSGGVIGFIIGTIQIPVWEALQIWWLLPIVGALVGLGTNYVAIQMIFRPLEPKRYFGFIRYQGLFPKRQSAIAADYGDTAEKEILTPETFIKMLTEGDRLSLLTDIVRSTIRERLEEEYQKAKPMIPVEVTPQMLDEVTMRVMMKMGSIVPAVQPQLKTYLDQKLDVANTVETRMAALPKLKFERIIRGIFEEDELTLIMVGGFLGTGVGFLQAALLLSMS